MQKKQKIILRILSLFVVAAIVFFFVYSEKKTDLDPVTTTSTSTSTINTFKINTESLTDNDSTYDIVVEYPQFTGIQTGSIEDKMNMRFKNAAKAIFEEISAELKNAAVGMEGREIIFERRLQADKTYINNQTGIMSIVYDNYTDTGGAHGTFFYSSETIDVKTGEKVVLADLLEDTHTTPLVKEIDSQIRNAAATCTRCDSLAGELKNLDVKLPETFVLSDQGITFLFGAYELGSYVATAGGQEVFVSKDFLNQYILRAW